MHIERAQKAKTGRVNKSPNNTVYSASLATPSTQTLRMAGSCYLCESSGHGICINNNTACQCFAGFAGPSCLDAVSIPSSGDASKNGAANWNIGAIIAGVLGGVLLTLIIVLIVFCCWKRRRDRKKNAIEFPLPSAPPKPVPVSSLYNVPLSEQYSSVSSTSTTTYHLYEELD